MDKYKSKLSITTEYKLKRMEEKLNQLNKFTKQRVNKLKENQQNFCPCCGYKLKEDE